MAVRPQVMDQLVHAVADHADVHVTLALFSKLEGVLLPLLPPFKVVQRMEDEIPRLKEAMLARVSAAFCDWLAGTIAGVGGDWA